MMKATDLQKLMRQEEEDETLLKIGVTVEKLAKDGPEFVVPLDQFHKVAPSKC